MSIAESFLNGVIGQRVSRVWRGVGSAIFLDLGTLSLQQRRDGSFMSVAGEQTLMIQWSWRISDENSILLGSWSDEDNWEDCLQRLVGSRVESAEIFGELPEILVHLSCGRRVASFMIADGQPSWALIYREPNIGTLCVNDGKLVVQPPRIPGSELGPH